MPPDRASLFTRPMRWAAQHTAAILAVSFLALGLMSTSLTVVEMPPYQNADEMNHFLRAEQISRLKILPRKWPPGIAGGVSDTGILRTAAPFLTIPFHYGVKATRSLYDALDPIKWRQSVYEARFPNTAIYPPFLYLPSAAGVWLGKATRCSVIQTLYLSRALTGLSATLVATFAILLAGNVAPWLFVILALPMSLSLIAAVSQDGMMIAFSALAASILSVALGAEHRLSTARFWVLCAALAMVCMARPPYLPLAFLLFLLPRQNLARQWLGVGIIVATTIGWSTTVLLIGGIHPANLNSDVSASRQLLGIVRHFRNLASVAVDTMSEHGAGYLEQIVGRLGWLDVELPIQYRNAAWVAVAVGAACCLSGGVVLQRWRPVALSFLLVLATALAIFGIQYLLYTPVGAPAVEGVQGRYFLPPLLFVACLVTGGRTRHATWIAPLVYSLVIFSIVSIAVMIRAIVLRYYI